MRAAALALAVLALAAQAGAGYSVDLGASLDGRTLRVAPRVSGPPGERLRYEIAVRRDGAAIPPITASRARWFSTPMVRRASRRRRSRCSRANRFR